MGEVVEHVEIERADQKLYPMRVAAQIMGLTLPAIRAQAWRGRIRTVKLGRRVMVPATEIERLQAMAS